MSSNTQTGINSLPNEVLTETFAFAIPSLHNTTFIHENIKLYTTRNALCRVCRHWNHLICSAARFWNSFFAFYDDYCTVPPPTELWQTWLKRSASYPLEIMLVGNVGLEGHVYDDRYPAGYHWNFLDIIKAHKQRWKKLYLVLDATDTTQFFSCLTLNDSQNLEELFIDTSAYLEEQLVDFFSKVVHAPNLRRLHWHAVADHPYGERADWPSDFEPYLHKLTHLDLNCNMSREELILLIGMCTSLTCLRLSQPFRSPSGGFEYDDPNIISLPSLHVLDVDESDVILYILDYFEFPNLKVLNICSASNHIFYTCMRLIDRLASAKADEKCSLQILRIEAKGSEFSPDDIPALLLQAYSFYIPVVEVEVPATHVAIQRMDQDILEILQVSPKSDTERYTTIIGWANKNIILTQEEAGYLSNCDIGLRME